MRKTVLQSVPSIIFKKVFGAFCSLKLAVLVILSLAFALGAGTFVESLYDTPTAQYWIYRAFWFRGILALLGINIFCVAVSRYPWQKKHFSFLLAHLGILMLLTGSWLTDRNGVDGNLRISEGETASIVDLDTAAFLMNEKGKVRAIPIQWVPNGVKFKPISTLAEGLPYDLKIDQFLTHADSNMFFIPNMPSPNDPQTDKKASAIRLKVIGSAMGMAQDIWLWQGEPAWTSFQAGPARFTLGEIDPSAPSKPGQPSLTVHLEKDGGLSYFARSSEGKVTQGKLPKNWVGKEIQPGWKAGVKVALVEFIADAVPTTSYKPSRIQNGPMAPSSAIHVVASDTVSLWLGLGDRAVLHLDNREVEIGYFPKRIVLPFSVHLEQFTVEHDQGTINPASYASRVTVSDGKGMKDVTISMNEPLEAQGFTLYQASYEDGVPRPVTSILAVNRDPGRYLKYIGSLLIVLGSIFLFAAKYRKGRKTGKSKSKAAPVDDPDMESDL